MMAKKPWQTFLNFNRITFYLQQIFKATGFDDPHPQYFREDFLIQVIKEKT